MPGASLDALSISSRKILLVEGQDEIHFFHAFLKHLNIEGVQLLSVGGKHQFPVKFPVFLNAPGFEQLISYAIIRDADTSHISTFDSIKDLLNKHGQPLPSKSGEFTIAPPTKVGIFILPGNSEQGMLESLCLQTVADHPAMPCVESFMRCLDSTLQRKRSGGLKDDAKAFHPKNEEKARMLAFLSSLHETTTSIGLAAQKGYWQFDHIALEGLRNFLRNLAE